MNTDELHNILLKRKTFFCYSGPLTEKILTAISVAVRLEIGENAGNERAEKIVFGNFVEQAQNIIRYSSEKTIQEDETSGVGTVALSLSDNKVLVEAVNAVDEKQMNTLTRDLTELKKMDSAELKSAYRNRLKDGPPEGSKGAGLGFMEIARKSDMWDFEFVKEHGKILFIFKVWS